MEATKEIRKEFAWSIKTQRLCTAAVRSHFNPEISNKEASRTTKAEAAQYIETARDHCKKWIAEQLDRGTITKRQASAAKRALDEEEAKARQLASRL